MRVPLQLMNLIVLFSIVARVLTNEASSAPTHDPASTLGKLHILPFLASAVGGGQGLSCRLLKS